MKVRFDKISPPNFELIHKNKKAIVVIAWRMEVVSTKFYLVSIIYLYYVLKEQKSKAKNVHPGIRVGMIEHIKGRFTDYLQRRLAVLPAYCFRFTKCMATAKERGRKRKKTDLI